LNLQYYEPLSKFAFNFNVRRYTKAMGKATHICTGCGYIYQETKPFAELSDEFVCPSCSAPKVGRCRLALSHTLKAPGTKRLRL
jgi:rubredoxin